MKLLVPNKLQVDLALLASLRMLDFCEECCGIPHELLATGADTDVRNMAADLQNIALLDGHPVNYLSRRSLVQNLWMEKV